MDTRRVRSASPSAIPQIAELKRKTLGSKPPPSTSATSRIRTTTEPIANMLKLAERLEASVFNASTVLWILERVSASILANCC